MSRRIAHQWLTLRRLQSNRAASTVPTTTTDTGPATASNHNTAYLRAADDEYLAKALQKLAKLTDTVRAADTMLNDIHNSLNISPPPSKRQNTSIDQHTCRLPRLPRRSEQPTPTKRFLDAAEKARLNLEDLASIEYPKNSANTEFRSELKELAGDNDKKLGLLEGLNYDAESFGQRLDRSIKDFNALTMRKEPDPFENDTASPAGVPMAAGVGGSTQPDVGSTSPGWGAGPTKIEPLARSERRQPNPFNESHSVARTVSITRDREESRDHRSKKAKPEMQKSTTSIPSAKSIADLQRDLESNMSKG